MASCLSLAQILAAAAWKFVARGVQLSKEVDFLASKAGQQQFNLRPGWLLGATQVTFVAGIASLLFKA